MATGNAIHKDVSLAARTIAGRITGSNAHDLAAIYDAVAASVVSPLFDVPANKKILIDMAENRIWPEEPQWAPPATLSRKDIPMTMEADVSVSDHGSIVLLSPVTTRAQKWCDEHLPEESPRLGRAWAVEPRYVNDILEGMCSDGLVIE